MSSEPTPEAVERAGTALVKQMAARHGVDLSKMKGTGAGGRITASDVLTVAASVRREAAINQDPHALLYGEPAPGQVRAAAGGRVAEFVSQFESTKRVQYDPYGANPLLEDLRQASPFSFTAASKEGQPPTLFESGSLPPFTASGVDPKELMKLPFGVRHTAAAEPDRGRLFRLFADAAAGDYDGALDDGARQYQQRVLRWAIGPTVRAT